MHNSQRDDEITLPTRFEDVIADSGGLPFTFDYGDMRTLHFDERFIQSAMRISQPDDLLLSYTRAMMGFLLFQPQPRHILMIGLGGGSLAKYCYRHLPDSRITVVELDPAIIALRGRFCVPDNDARFQVVQADAVDYVAKMHEPVDIILHDGYSADGLPAPLSATPFYRQCLKALTPAGVLVSNLWGEDLDLLPAMQRLHSVFDARLWWCHAQHCLNRIVFSCKDIDTEAFQSSLARRAVQQELRHGELGLCQLAQNLSTSAGRSQADFEAIAGNDMYAAYMGDAAD